MIHTGLWMKSRTNHKKLELHTKVIKNKIQEVNKKINQKSWNPWDQIEGNGKPPSRIDFISRQLAKQNNLDGFPIKL